jgi:hypothetical protein
MDQGGPAEEVYAVSGGVEGSRGDAVRTCLLLGLYRGLGEGEARVPAVQERGNGAAYLAVAGRIAEKQ